MSMSNGGMVRRGTTRAAAGAADAPGVPLHATDAPHAPESTHGLAGQMGAEVASALSSALERVEQLARTGRIGRPALQALLDELARARQVAMLGQQVHRLAAGQVRQSPEPLELPEVLREVLVQRRGAAAARGLELRQVLQPATVSADASLLFALLCNLLDWALEHSRAQTVTFSTGMNPWPVHGVLQCRFAWRAPDRLGPEAELAHEVDRQAHGGDAPALGTVGWRLVEQAAAAMGVQLLRADSPWQVDLALHFAEAPRRWPRLVESLDDEAASTRLRAQPLAGTRVLAHIRRPDVLHVVHEATTGMGLMLDHVGSLADLHACVLAVPPDVLLIDERGSEVDRVLAEIGAGTGRGPALVQVAETFRGLEVSSGPRREILRVARDTAMRDLPAALSYALMR
jgi:hypothetical protein